MTINNSQTEAPNRAVYSLLSSLFNSLEDTVTDFIINPNGTAFKYHSSGEVQQVSPSPLKAGEIKTLAPLLAGLNRENISENSPSVSSKVYISSRAARLEILLPPAVSSPSLSVRFYVFSDINLLKLSQTGMFTTNTMYKLKDYVKDKKNIIISGSTGSGKTTLLSALVNEIPQTERVIIIEDLPEVDCTLPNHTRIIATMSGAFNGSEAIIRTLRMRPDRIIYGEVRNESAFDLLDAWNTGHSGGLGTVHASSTIEALDRLSKLASRKSQNISYDTCRDITASAVDIVIQLGIKNSQRQIIDIYENKHEGKI